MTETKTGFAQALNEHVAIEVAARDAAAQAIPPPRRAKLGEAREWLESFLANPTQTDDCVIWPFSCSGRAPKGYPQIGILGKTYRVTRIILTELVGPPPEGRYEAAHAPVICHQPRCVNPRHLRWATPKENAADTFIDETHTRGDRQPTATLTNDDALSIYHATGTQAEIAERFGVPRSTVANIKSGQTWSAITGHLQTPEKARAVVAAGVRRANHKRLHPTVVESCERCMSWVAP